RFPKNIPIQNAANTFILAVVALPLMDAAYRWNLERTRQQSRLRPIREKIYSFETAKADPVQFKFWWDRFVREWGRLSRKITVPDPENKLPFRLKPGSSGSFFDSQIRINSLGFRDREFDRDKKNHYRIVTIGESTTMGITLRQRDRPWPRVLGGLIRTNLDCKRPVEVINAGVAVYNLEDNLIRLKEDVLPLKPDMVISYHGYNGFHFLRDTLANAQDLPAPAPPPSFSARPLLLLAQAEYQFRLLQFRHQYDQPALPPENAARLRSAVTDSECARLYRKLISIARRNNLKLVLLSFNMAVDDRSPQEVVDFYKSGFPDVGYRIQANRLQTYLLEEIARRNPDVLYLNTADGLDGDHENFIDLVHLTQQGKNKLAENIFEGIKASLPCDESLARPPAEKPTNGLTPRS
ncbi:MAG: hypothetical protein HYY23_02870, partial [Verrucomicrobia bacterium]|nr:hypothetical protein [Verrucomicrobiota bacterium]